MHPTLPELRAGPPSPKEEGWRYAYQKIPLTTWTMRPE
jgi:hypothetical protein